MPTAQPHPDLAASLAPLTLEAAEGAAVRLGDLWASRPVVLAHVRHFGWLFCREHVAQLRDHEDDIAARGAGVAVIGTGDADYARDIAARLRVRFPLLVDPDLRSYRVAGARRASPLGVLSPSSLTAAVRTTVARRVRQGRTGRHPFQLGATHVIEPGGRVPFAWVNADFSDNAPVAAVLTALDG